MQSPNAADILARLERLPPTRTMWTLVVLLNPCSTRKPTPYWSSTGLRTPRIVPFSDHTSQRTGCWFQKSRR